MAELQNNKRKGEECSGHFYTFYFKSEQDPHPNPEDVVISKRDAVSCQVKIRKEKDEEN